MNIILASKSDRRKQLLELTNYKFQVIYKDVDETINPKNDLKQEIKNIAYKKAQAVNDNTSIIIGADTFIVIDDIILVKPKDTKDAYDMLSRLSNRKHKVYTGVAIIYKDVLINWCEEATVYFKELSDKEILDYIDTKEPMDKAGSYAIQGKGALFVDRIEGDYYSIMGLPISKVNTYLNGIHDTII